MIPAVSQSYRKMGVEPSYAHLSQAVSELSKQLVSVAEMGP